MGAEGYQDSPFYPEGSAAETHIPGKRLRCSKVRALDELDDARTYNSHGNLRVEREALREAVVLRHALFLRHIQRVGQGARTQRLVELGEKPETSIAGILNASQQLFSGLVHDMDAGPEPPAAPTI